jgi:hypothetical protein
MAELNEAQVTHFDPQADLDALAAEMAAAARAATDGRWERDPDGDLWAWDIPGMPRYVGNLGNDDDPADGQYVIAAQPRNVLALLAERETLVKQRNDAQNVGRMMLAALMKVDGGLLSKRYVEPVQWAELVVSELAAQTARADRLNEQLDQRYKSVSDLLIKVQDEMPVESGVGLGSTLEVAITALMNWANSEHARADRLAAENAALTAWQQSARRWRRTARYYEGSRDSMYDAIVGEDGPKHRFNNRGICIRCGEDAEEWDAGCVEELRAALAAAGPRDGRGGA